MEYLKTIYKKRYPKIDGDFIDSPVHQCLAVFPSGIYRIVLPSGKFKFFEIKSYHSIILGPAYQVIREVTENNKQQQPNKR